MSFTGDLEHLPIVDVIQLLHATRKSGILRVSCHKGESQLVFKDGFIVCANHLNGKVRIGKILMDLGVISEEDLDQALEFQNAAGQDRKPLVITLIEKGLVKESDAYKGLEQLIEMTVVEILTWKGGTFTLDVMPQSVDDQYRYFPEKMNREINVDTQGILMNALRIFDEKKRDGILQEDEAQDEDIVPEAPEEKGDEPLLSVQDLGLDALDDLKSKPPEIYKVLEDTLPSEDHLQHLEALAPGISVNDRRSLAEYLDKFTISRNRGKKAAEDGHKIQHILIYSSDELLRYCMTVVCRDPDLAVFTTNEESYLAQLMGRFLTEGIPPVLVLDCRISGEETQQVEEFSELRSRLKEKFPKLCIIQLGPEGDAGFAMQAYAENVRAVFPRPFQATGIGNFAADLVRFLEAFRVYIRNCRFLEEHSGIGDVRECITLLRDISGAPEAALLLLKFVATLLDRSVTFVVRGDELIAEKGVGFSHTSSKEIIPSMGIRIPLRKPSVFHDVIEKGIPFYGHVDDVMLKNFLFQIVGAPLRNSILLLPLRHQGKTISITYGDSGADEPAAVDMNLLGILADSAEQALTNAIFRKRIKKPEVDG